MDKKIEVSKGEFNIIMNALIQAKDNSANRKNARQAYEEVFNKLLNQ